MIQSNLASRIETLATRLAEPTAKISVRPGKDGAPALWEEEMTTKRAGYVTPAALSNNYVQTHRPPKLEHRRQNAWGMSVGAVAMVGFGAVMLATGVLGPVGGGIFLALGIGLGVVAAVEHWRAGSTQRALTRLQAEADSIRLQLQGLLLEAKAPHTL